MTLSRGEREGGGCKSIFVRRLYKGALYSPPGFIGAVSQSVKCLDNTARNFDRQILYDTVVRYLGKESAAYM